MEPPSLSVFFPAYNEERNIKKTVETAVKFLQRRSFPWEIIIIDDGSTDESGKLADRLAQIDRHISVIHQANGGYGMALRAGFSKGKYEWIAYMDSDGQFDFTDIHNFFELAPEADAIWGYRLKRNDPLPRKIFSKLWAISLFLFFGLKFRDVNCGFKMIRRQAYQQLGTLESHRGGMINAELAIKLQRSGVRIKEVGVHHYPRVFGSASGASPAVVLGSYLDLFKLWWKLNRDHAKKS